ncbi:hypothetical protein ZHAS_00004188 [Anopheles sinensis]|uniref:Uncharacterized protein n=1 Tax=Anopheles sinensis TaxID=74873 RepID=A0A084VG96_ANOSI|nr:hypothetical protein ZHAS_00004188 [Anopheles sinensis]
MSDLSDQTVRRYANDIFILIYCPPKDLPKPWVALITNRQAKALRPEYLANDRWLDKVTVSRRSASPSDQGGPGPAWLMHRTNTSRAGQVVDI